MNDVIVLIFAHLFGDYVLQNNFLATVKANNNFILFVHSFLWSASVYFAMNMISVATVSDFMYLLVGHLAIDYMKCKVKDKEKQLTTYLYADQFLHMVQIMCVYLGNQ